MVSIGLDGIPHDVGSDISAALESDPVLAREAEAEQEETKVAIQVVDAANKEEQKSDGKLILAEEIVEGRISWKALKLFLDGLGGGHPFLFMTIWMGGLTLAHIAISFGVWFLGYWGSQYENHRPEQVNVPQSVLSCYSFSQISINVTLSVISYLFTYTLILVSFTLVYALAATFFNFGTQRASRSIGAKLVDSVLGSTLRLVKLIAAS